MTVNVKRKLDFFILGAQKAGSSWLAERLRGHPDIFIPKNEIHFFDVQRNYERGLSWYFRHFRHAGPDQLLGEKTPSMYVVRADQTDQPIPQRLADHNPGLKFFVVLRDPVKRTQSALLHQIWKGRLPATASPFDLLFGEHADRASHFGILEQGLYYRQLVPFLDTFSIERFRFYNFERDLTLSPAQTLADAETFLDLTQGHCTNVETGRKRNRSVRSTAALRWNSRFPRLGHLWQLYDRIGLSNEEFGLDANLTQKLYEYFKEDIERLERELGMDLSHWRPASGSNDRNHRIRNTDLGTTGHHHSFGSS